MLIRDNLEVGIRINNNFPGVGFNETGRHTFEEITIISGGTFNDLYNNPVGAIDIFSTNIAGTQVKNVSFKNIDILDSKNDAIMISNNSGDGIYNLSFENIFIDGTGREYPFNNTNNLNWGRGYFILFAGFPNGNATYCNMNYLNRGGNADVDVEKYGIGNFSWSLKTNCIDLDNLQLIAPTNQASDQIYTSLILDWTDIAGASTYQLQIDETQNFSKDPQIFSTTSSTYTVNLLPSKTYYWRVRASSSTTWGQWTKSWYFTTINDIATSSYDISFSDLKIYPNPSSGNLNIESSTLLRNKPYRLIDTRGNELSSGIINSNHIIIELNKFSTGIYFLQIGDAPQQTYKLFKK